MRNGPIRAAAGLALALLLPVSAAIAHEEGGTHVEELSASVSGGFVVLDGTATFIDAPAQVATDPSGDATPANVGTDLTAGVVSRPDPARSEAVFRLDVADDIPALFGLPETMHYGWAFGVNTGGGVQNEYLLQSLRTANAQAAGNTNPFFRLLRFRADATCCDPVTTVPGTMADGAITWTVPLFRIGAADGGSIEPHSARPIQVQIGASGQRWLNSGQPDQMFVDDSYEIPVARVDAGIAPAGTPVEQVPLTGDASVDPATGGFTGALSVPAEPGDYIVVARACYGSGDCGTASATITV